MYICEIMFLLHLYYILQCLRLGQSPKSVMNGDTEKSTAPQAATPPPTSKLVSRLFPNLKQEASKQQKTEQVGEFSRSTSDNKLK